MTQKLINHFKSRENWSSILINIENIYVPNMYAFLTDSVCIKLGENKWKNLKEALVLV